MSRYEIWDQEAWESGGSPSNVVHTLDTAMLEVQRLSSSEVVYFVLDKSQVPSKVRGFGIASKWLDAVANCKRCHNYGFL